MRNIYVIQAALDQQQERLLCSRIICDLYNELKFYKTKPEKESVESEKYVNEFEMLITELLVADSKSLKEKEYHIKSIINF